MDLPRKIVLGSPSAAGVADEDDRLPAGGCGKVLRLLLIEDDPADADLIVRHLERHGYAVSWQRVDSGPGLETALEQSWDAITCDWVMAGFGAAAALEILSRHQVDAAVIIVSGQAAEEVTVTAMRAGAQDVVSKQKLTRLGPAIARSLLEAEERRARRQAEANLRVSELRYRRLFETARDGILIVDGKSGQITDVNPFLVELLGYDRDQLVGKQLWELGPFRDIAANQTAFRELQAQDFIRYDHLPLESRDGRRTDVEFVSNAYLVDGERVIQCNIRDISARKRDEQAAIAANDELERRVRERTAQAEVVNQELEAFSYSVSHDLRASLRHVEGFSQLLVDGYATRLDDLGRHYVERIHAGAVRMQQLVTDLLSLSRVGRVELQPQPVNLSALCESIVAELRKGDPDRRVEFVVEPGVVATGDAGLLRAALENLLCNSWKFTGSHPSARIEFGTMSGEGGPVYFVRDDGAGFDMAHAEKLFRAFQRMHSDAQFEGTGIGLATVQRIIQRHGGRVWADAAVERGATIHFTLGSA